MSIKEFYETIGGDYESIVGRLRNDDLIKKFLIKFLDEKSYDELVVAYKANDVAESILAAHKMKGVVANLSFTKLFEVLTAFLQDLRQENQTVVNEEMMNQVTIYYDEVIAAIKEL